MTKFIKLTECNGDLVLLNIDRIEHITLGSKGTDTYIKLLSNLQGKPNESIINKENYFFVKETVEQIWDMLEDEMLIGMDAII